MIPKVLVVLRLTEVYFLIFFKLYFWLIDKYVLCTLGRMGRFICRSLMCPRLSFVFPGSVSGSFWINWALNMRWRGGGGSLHGLCLLGQGMTLGRWLWETLLMNLYRTRFYLRTFTLTVPPPWVCPEASWFRSAQRSPSPLHEEVSSDPHI